MFVIKDARGTGRKFEGSIPDGVIRIFHLLNPFGRTMAQGFTQPLNRNEYQEYFLGGKGGRCVGLTTSPPTYADCLEIREPQTPETLRACPGLYKNCFVLLCFACLLLCRINSQMTNYRKRTTQNTNNKLYLYSCSHRPDNGHMSGRNMSLTTME